MKPGRTWRVRRTATSSIKARCTCRWSSACRSGRKGIQVDGNVSLVDIVPTVLDLLGLENPGAGGGREPPRGPGRRARAGRGSGRFTASRCMPATFGCSPLHGIVEGPWKYILAPRPELYDLSQDPGEGTNLVGKQPQVAQRLRGRLEAMLKKLETAAVAARPVDRGPGGRKAARVAGLRERRRAPPASAVDTTREDPKDFLPTYMRLLRREGHSSTMLIATQRPSRNCWKLSRVGPHSSCPMNCWLASRWTSTAGRCRGAVCKDRGHARRVEGSFETASRRQGRAR